MVVDHQNGPMWAALSRGVSGKAFKAEILRELSNVKDKLVWEKDQSEFAALQGRAQALKEILFCLDKAQDYLDKRAGVDTINRSAANKF